MSKTPNEYLALIGETVSFAIQVTNTGSANAENVTINDAVPGANVSAWTSSPDTPTCTVDNSAADVSLLHCELDFPLPPGAIFGVIVTATAGSDCFAELNNTAYATADNAPTVSDSGRITIMCGTRTPSPTPSPTPTATPTPPPGSPTPTPTVTPAPTATQTPSATPLFARADEIEAAWSIVDEIIAGWRDMPPQHFPNYEAGSWGPPEADAMIEADGRKWREP